MKKLLSILGAVGLTATGASSVVACGKPNKEKKPTPVVETKPNKEKDIGSRSGKSIPVGNESDTQTKFIEYINNEKQRKMKYFNELNSKIQKTKTELVKRIKILESKNKGLDQQQTSIKEEIQQLEKEINQLNNQVGKTGSEAVELAHKKQIKITENRKNYKFLELIINQLDENKTKIKQLKTQIEQEKFYISEINSISSPTKIMVPITQQNENKIYVLEKDINKIILNQLQKKINNNLTAYDFIIEFESKYISHNGIVAIELSHSKTIKIKIHGKNNIVGETS